MPFNQHVFRASCAVLLGLGSAVPCPGAQDRLQAVRDLYASAAYEDALSAVGKFDVAEPSPEAEQYRVFCLVALGRVAEADQAVERLLTARPEYHPNSTEASPRIQALFAQVRQRVGPALVKRTYQRARAAMERRDRDSAVAEFEAMLRMADDPDVRADPAMAELKELGAGFLELSRNMPASAPAVPATLLQQDLSPSLPQPRVAQRHHPTGGDPAAAAAMDPRSLESLQAIHRSRPGPDFGGGQSGVRRDCPVAPSCVRSAAPPCRARLAVLPGPT